MTITYSKQDYIYHCLCSLINCVAVSITVEAFPLIVDIPNKLVCNIAESPVFTMEMVFNTSKLLTTANATNSIALTLSPNQSFNGTNMTCMATTASGLYYENNITLWVKGRSWLFGYFKRKV